MPSGEKAHKKDSSSENMMMLSPSVNSFPMSDLRNYSEERVAFSSDPLLFRGSMEGIGPNDVLCGRNKEAFNHFGNQRFRQAINNALESYKNAQSRREKSSITLSIFESIRSQGGRFLKRDEETGKLTLLTDQQSKEKIAHAVRDVVNKSQARKRAKGAVSEALASATTPYAATGLGNVGVDHQVMESQPRIRSHPGDGLGRSLQQQQHPFGGTSEMEMDSNASKQPANASIPPPYPTQRTGLPQATERPFDDLLWAIEYNLGPLTSEDLSDFQQGRISHPLEDLEDAGDLEPYGSF